jgi:hypothetical protein
LKDLTCTLWVFHRDVNHCIGAPVEASAGPTIELVTVRHGPRVGRQALHCAVLRVTVFRQNRLQSIMNPRGRWAL